jgi:hypothetical protein
LNVVQVYEQRLARRGFLVDPSQRRAVEQRTARDLIARLP